MFYQNTKRHQKINKKFVFFFFEKTKKTKKQKNKKQKKKKKNFFSGFLFLAQLTKKVPHDWLSGWMYDSPSSSPKRVN